MHAFPDYLRGLLKSRAFRPVPVRQPMVPKTSELKQKIGFFPISPSGNVATFIADPSNSVVAFKAGDYKRESAAR